MSLGIVNSYNIEKVNNKTEIIRFLKYASVGVSNTVITFVTFTLLRFFGVGTAISNVLGYIAGMVNSFCWNRQWVFKSREGNSIHQAFWFLIGAALCWAVQWIIFKILLDQGFNESVAYLTGMVAYTLLNYLFNKMVTFRKP